LWDTPENSLVADRSFGKIFGRDIHRLRKGEWLNDEIINYYLSMLRTRSLSPSALPSKPHSKTFRSKMLSTHVFSSFFYSLLTQRGYSAVRRWTKKAKVNLFELDRVVLPINKGGFHWILAIVNVEMKRIEYYDSMGREGVSNENRPVLETIRSYMADEAKQYGIKEDLSKWTFHVPVQTLGNVY
jgi:sentrin-specific protease 1